MIWCTAKRIAVLVVALAGQAAAAGFSSAPRIVLTLRDAESGRPVKGATVTAEFVRTNLSSPIGTCQTPCHGRTVVTDGQGQCTISSSKRFAMPASFTAMFLTIQDLHYETATVSIRPDARPPVVWPGRTSPTWIVHRISPDGKTVEITLRVRHAMEKPEQDPPKPENHSISENKWNVRIARYWVRK